MVNIHALIPRLFPRVRRGQRRCRQADRTREQASGLKPGLRVCKRQHKTYGESLAQILWLLVKPMLDSVGRVKLEPIPEELVAPRCGRTSGVFRDLFINRYLDRSGREDAASGRTTEQNFVRKHTEQANKREPPRDAACRCSPTSGSYSSNVNLAVENSTSRRR